MAFALSDKGRVREHNEDAFGLFPERGLFLVSDGMGGKSGGATASKFVVDRLPQTFAESVDAIPNRNTKAISLALRDAFVELSRQVRQRGDGDPDLQGMGATLVLAYLRKSSLYIANMGDSRAYLFRAGKLEQLTEDHSIVAIMIRNGEITAEEAKTHPARGIVSRHMGMAGVVYPDVKTIKVSPGDRLLLCSDGLTGMVSDQFIAAVLLREIDPEIACRSLVFAANEAGGRDNITVLIVALSA